MKKCLSLLFTAVAMLGMSVAFMACNEHTHSCSTWVTVTDPTCTSEGLQTGICDICGTEVTQTLEKLPHSYRDWNTTVLPKCTQTGERERKCDVCGETETETVQATGHTELVIAGTPATCTATGLTDKTVCSVCGETLVEQQTIPMTPHNFNDWVVVEAADCEVPGEKERVCADCFYRETEEIEALHHDWGAWEHDASNPGKHKRVCQNNENHVIERSCTYSPERVVDPTCIEGGYTLEICADCKHEIKTNLIDPLGHLYNDWIPAVVEGGEEAEGHVHWHYRECERCHDSEAREKGQCELEQEGEEIAPTCIKAGYKKWVCPSCQAVHEEITQPATGHSMKFYQRRTSGTTAVHYEECDTCHIKTEEQSCVMTHQISPATCTQNETINYLCSICSNGFKISGGTQALGHKYGPWKFTGDASHRTHEQQCERCGDTVSGNCELDRIENLPTCTDDGSIQQVCKYCLEGFTENGQTSLGHNWIWTMTETQHTQYCDRCKTTITEEHNFEQIEHNPATCEQAESFVDKCPDCQKTRTRSGSNKLGHVWTVQKITATTHELLCSLCGESKVAPHDWSDSNLCADCEHDELEYRLEGIHCYVTNKGKIRSANIVIPKFHKVLNTSGEGYQTSQYEVKGIDRSAFQFFTNDNIYTKSVTIPESVEIIDTAAFLNCLYLEEFSISGETPALKTIGDNAFANCRNLTKFEAPATLVSIGSGAFCNCSKLAEIEVKDNDKIQNIGQMAFYNTAFANDDKNWQYEDADQQIKTDALYIGKHLIKARQVGQNTEFVVLEGTISISESAFSDFVNLTKITLPAGIKTIDRNAFEKCENIVEVEFLGDLHQWFDIQFLNDYASPLFHGNAGLHIANAHDDIDLSDKQITKIPAGTFRNTTIDSIILPESLTEIGEEAFEGCSELTSVTFKGYNVRVVGANAFTGSGVFVQDESGAVYVDYILVKVSESVSGHFNVKDGTLTIANEAFKGCTNLQSVTIDEATVFVGVEAFSGCSSMQSIEFEDKTYRWLISVKNSIGRSFPAAELTWNTLQSYTGSWKRYDIAG